MKFENVLAAQLELNPKLNRGSLGRNFRRANKGTKEEHDAIMARLEAHARVHLGYKQTGKVDWSNPGIDWNGLLSFLTLILPMILTLFGL